MALPLIAGVLGTGVLGWFLVSAVGTLVHWAALGAGGVIAFQSLRLLLDEDPVPVTESETLNGLIYAGMAVFTGFVAFKLIQAVFVTFGVLLAILLGLALVTGWLFGFKTVLDFVVSAVGVTKEVVGR